MRDAKDNQNGVCRVVKAGEADKGLIRGNEFQKYPRCGIVVEKASGVCRQGGDERHALLLYVRRAVVWALSQRGQDGTRHFPEGVYKACTKAHKSESGCLVM